MTTSIWTDSLNSVSYTGGTHLNLTDLCYSVSISGIQERVETSTEVNLISQNLGEINDNVVSDQSQNPNLNPEIIFSSDGTLSLRNINGSIENLILAWNESITADSNIDISFLKNDIGISILSEGFTEFSKKEFHFRVPIVINNDKILKNYYITQKDFNLNLNNQLIDLFKINNNLNQNLTINNNLTVLKTSDGTLYKLLPTESTDIQLFYRTILN